MVMLFKPEQAQKHPSPKLATELEIVMLVNPKQP